MTAIETPTSVNGNGHHDDEYEAEFPLDTFREAARHMRRPFGVNAVKFKVQAVTPKDDPKKALVVAYIDARLVVERLNLLLPDKWFDTFEAQGSETICRLTVDGITREDIGDGKGKTGRSDSLKRAAVKFGIGVSLYAIPQAWIDGGMVRQVRTKEGMTLAITDAGDQFLRTKYARWLEQEGERKFGPVLDHGDAVGAIGDPADVTPIETSEAGNAAVDDIDAGIADKQVTQQRAKHLVGIAFDIGVQDKLQLAASHVAGGDVGDCSTKTKAAAALMRLNVEQADKVEQWISRKADEASARDEGAGDAS